MKALGRLIEGVRLRNRQRRWICTPFPVARLVDEPAAPTLRVSAWESDAPDRIRSVVTSYGLVLAQAGALPLKITTTIVLPGEESRGEAWALVDLAEALAGNAGPNDGEWSELQGLQGSAERDEQMQNLASTSVEVVVDGGIHSLPVLRHSQRWGAAGLIAENLALTIEAFPELSTVPALRLDPVARVLG